MALAAGCASRPEAPILQAPGSADAQTSARLDALLPADVLILGEQHDAAQHQQIEQQVVAARAVHRAGSGVCEQAAFPRGARHPFR